MRTLVLEGDFMITNAYRTLFVGIANLRHHKGVDFGCPKGTPVKNVAKSKVYATGHDSMMGLYVWVQHEDGTGARYMHLSRVDAVVGQDLSPGQIIGFSGNSGNTTGYHLHFELLSNYMNPNSDIDPMAFILNNISYSLPIVNIDNMEQREYTVTQADGLGLESIAIKLYGDKGKVFDLVDWNKDRYPLIATNVDGITGNDTLWAGWVLRYYVPKAESLTTESAEVTVLKQQLVEAQSKEKQALELAHAVEIARKEEALLAAAEAEKRVEAIAIEAKNKYAIELKQVETHAIDVGTKIAEESVDFQGPLNRWAEFIDNHFQSKTLRSLLKYDIFVYIGTILGGISLPLLLPQADQRLLLIPTIVIGIVGKLLVTRYDTNKDGILDMTDTQVLQAFVSVKSPGGYAGTGLRQD